MKVFSLLIFSILGKLRAAVAVAAGGCMREGSLGLHALPGSAERGDGLLCNLAEGAWNGLLKHAGRPLPNGQLLGRGLMVLWLAAVCCVQPALGQDSHFSGKVIDGETGAPLRDAALIAEEGVSMFGLSDANGHFHIRTEVGQARFAVSLMGYKTQLTTLHADSTALIALVPARISLGEVVVEQEKSDEKGLATMAQISLDRAVLSRHSAAGLGEALAQVDGVTFISTGTNIQLPVIHGLYGNRILVLNDGFRHGFQNWGRDHAPEIDVAGAQRIKVVKGAAGVKYGPDALGGAVVVENNDLALSKPFYASATTTYQTNGRGYGGSARVGEGRKHFSYHLGASYRKVGDRRAPRYNLTNTGAAEVAFQGGLKYSKGPWAARANYSMVQQNLGILRAAIGSSGPALIRNMEADIPSYIRDFSYEINEPRQWVGHQLASASLSRHLHNGKLSLRYARQWNARREYDVRRNADLPVLDLDLTTDDLQLEWEHSAGDRLSGSLGVQYFGQANRNNPGTLITPFIPNYATRRWSVFLLETLQAALGSWEFGIRYDLERNVVSGRDSRQEVFRDQFSFGNATAAVGRVLPLGRHSKLRSHIGMGWRPPNMAELYSFGQHEAQTTFGLLRYEPADGGGIQASRVIPLRESGVAPENSLKYTTELEWQRGGHRFSATAYANYIRNFIFSRPIGVLGTARGPMPTFIMDQSDALFLGTDLTYTRAYHANGRATLGASYIYTRNVARSETLINQPPIHLHLRVEQSFLEVGPFEKLTCGIHPSYTFAQFQAPRAIPIRALVEGTTAVSTNDPIFDFQEAPPGYFLLHAWVQAHKGRFSLAAEARNVLNTSYRDYLNNMRYFADELGINLIFSLTYTL